MEEIIIYLLKSSIVLAVSVTLFMLLLRNETFHRINRVLLLVIAIFSLVAPFVNLGVDSPMARFSLMLEQLVMGDAPVVTQGGDVAVEMPVAMEMLPGDGSVDSCSFAMSGLSWLMLVYAIVAALLVVRLIYMYVQVVLILRKGRVVDTSPYTKDRVRMSVHDGDYSPFSWFGWLSVSRKDLQESGREIVAHETAHIRYCHSWDIFVADLLIIVQWFNPMAWMVKSLLKDIHEFEADEAVIASGVNAKEYQLLIIKKAVGSRLYSIANSFNHSLTIKRITMMCKKKSSLWHCAKVLYMVPVAVVAACTFSSAKADDGSSGAKGSENVANVATECEKNRPVIVDGDSVLREVRIVLKGESATSLHGESLPEVNVAGYKSESEKKDSIHQVVEQMPEFPGGMTELMKYINTNIKYPEEAKKAGAQGKTIVSFVVETDGAISDVEVMRSSGNHDLDAESVRVVRSMPKWKPAMHKGKKVRVRFTLPVMFRLA